MNAVTALDLKENESKFPHLQFGCPNIDQTIGHILSAGITELSGEAGVGKSQVCMHLALRCQLSPQLGGCGGTAAYMSCGEGEFPIRRLSQMAVAMTGALREVHGESVPALQLEQVFIEEIPTHEHLRESLEKKLPDMCRNQNLKLLIIDSIAGALRTEFDASKSSEMSSRTQYLFKLATHLKWLADTFRISVLLVNQVTERFEDSSAPIDLCGYSSGAERFGWDVFQRGHGHTVPVLGLAWSHCVNTRIVLFKSAGHRAAAAAAAAADPLAQERESEQQGPTQEAEAQRLPRRVMQLQFSPRYAAPAICPYAVSLAGIIDY